MKVLVLISGQKRYQDIWLTVRHAFATTGVELVTMAAARGDLPYFQQVVAKAREVDALIIADGQVESDPSFARGINRTIGIPVMILRPEEQRSSPDNELHFLYYDPKSTTSSLLDKLRFWLVDLENILKPIPNGRKIVFVSYHHKDENYLQRLNVHFAPFIREGQLEVLSDRQISPGTSFDDFIISSIKKSDAIILLISADFLNSSYITEKEMPMIWEQKISRKILLLPMVSRPCLLESNDQMGLLHTINSPERPLSAMNEAEQDEVFAKALRHLISLKK